MADISISIRKGKGNLRHNIDSEYRMKLSHIDGSLVDKDYVLINEDIKNVFHKLFDDALLKYNAKYLNDSKHQNRIINNYYQHIKLGKQEKTHHELIIEVGKKGDGINDSVKIQILKEIVKKIQRENPNLYVFQATIHNDEPDSGPHLHLDYVPFITNQKRGLSTRVSHDKSLMEMGYKKEKCISSIKDKSPNVYNGFRNQIEQELEKIMQKYDLHHVYIHDGKENENHREWRKRIEYNKQLDKEIEQKKKALGSIEAKVSTITVINQIRARESKINKTDVIIDREDYHTLKKTALASAKTHAVSKKVKEANEKLQREDQMLKNEIGTLTQDINKLKEENGNLNTFLKYLRLILLNQFGIDIIKKRKQIIEVGKWLANFASYSVNSLVTKTTTIFDKISRIFAEIGFKEPLYNPTATHIVSNKSIELMNTEEKQN